MKLTNKKKTSNSVDKFKTSNRYIKASQSENPKEQCKNCSFLFTFKKKTRCYAYEQQNFKDDNIVFHPRRDFNCTSFDDTDNCDYSIKYYLKALAKGIDPQKDTEYQKAPKEENDNYEILRSLEHENVYKEKHEEWDDPSTYARCSDWEDEPKNCFHCADDDCPMNRS